MRQMISGMVAAVAVMAAAPAMACGSAIRAACSPCAPAYVSPCAASVYAAPVLSYSYTNYGGCYGGCGWATERLPDPLQQYYYVNQGPTYTGPGNWAPEPAYQAGPGYGGIATTGSGYGYGRGYGYAPSLWLWLSRPWLRLRGAPRVCAALRALSLRPPPAAPLLLIRLPT